jgi:GTP-binding protein EngB required for normal cell division
MKKETEETIGTSDNAIVFERVLENFTMITEPKAPSSKSSRHGSDKKRRSSGSSLFKVILLGDSKVGKSSIVMRLVDQ